MPKSATPGGTIPSASAEISHDIRHRLTAPCVAVATDLTPPVSARATTSATCATSDPSRSRCSPALRLSIVPVSSVIRHAKMRLLIDDSIDVRASPVVLERRNLAKASAARIAASSMSGLAGIPRLLPPALLLPMRS